MKTYRSRVSRLTLLITCGVMGLGCTGSDTEEQSSDLTKANAQIMTGAGTTCFLTKAKGVRCWGKDHFGSFGDGVKNEVQYTWKKTVAAQGLEKEVASIAGGWSGTGVTTGCAVTTDGAPAPWLVTWL